MRSSALILLACWLQLLSSHTSADANDCLGQSALTIEDLHDRVESALFRVVMQKPGAPPKVIGTAYLIAVTDTRSYFISARHILRTLLPKPVPDAWTSDKSSLDILRSSTLALKSGDKSFQAKIIVDESFGQAFDGVIIEAQKPTDSSFQPIVLGLGVYQTACQQSVAFAGYQVGDESPKTSTPIWNSVSTGGGTECSSDDEFKQTYTITSLSRNGNSGSVVVTADGLGIGLHIRGDSTDDTPPRNISTVQRLSTLGAIFGAIPLPKRVGDLVDDLNSGILQGGHEVIFSRLRTWDDVSLARLQIAVTQSSGQPVRKSLGDLILALTMRLGKSCMFNQIAELGKLGNKRAELLPRQSIDLARQLLQVAQIAQASGEAVIAADSARSAVSLFQAAGLDSMATIAMAQGDIEQPRYFANALYDYSQALRVVRTDDPRGIDTRISSVLASAYKLDPENPVIASGILQSAWDTQNFALAAASAATVNQLLSSTNSNSKWQKGAEKDWFAAISRLKSTHADKGSELTILEDLGIEKSPNLSNFTATMDFNSIDMGELLNRWNS